MITDEMVTKAGEAYVKENGGGFSSFDMSIRAALEAVAPMLIAQGMREAVEIAQVIYDDPENNSINSPDFWSGIDDVKEAILARVQELENLRESERFKVD